MSHGGMIIDIPRLEIERVKRREGIEVWAKPSWRPSRTHCGGTHATHTQPHPTTRRRPIHHEPHRLASSRRVARVRFLWAGTWCRLKTIDF
jgi:hypothetical protein